MGCPDENVLLDLSRGRLAGAALEQAEAHLDGCSRCRRAVAELLRDSTVSAAAAPAPAPIRPGTCIGRYVVIERVGAGATGQVLAAYDPVLDRKVALKLLRPHASSEEHKARLVREAKTLARLAHPNVVTLFDVGEWEGQVFISLEFVAGGSAADWVARQGRAWRDVVTLFVQAGRGLAAAHEAGVVHRDFKPDNVLVHPDGRALVTDFGLAGHFESSAGGGHARDVGLTHSGALLGTPAYMAPDQLEGRPASAASDQFSFCVALFEALYGQKPWRAETVAELVKAQQSRALVVPERDDVPAAVRRVVLRGLEPDAAARFPSMTALVFELERAARGSRRVVPVAVALFGVSALALGGGLLLGQRVRVRPACALAAERHAKTWGPGQRAALKSAFAATKLGYADKQLDLVRAALDARASAWSAQALEACEASHEAADGAKAWHARLACLDERFAELESIVSVFASPSNETVTRAARVVERLPGPGACASAAETVRFVAAPAELQQRSQATALAATASALNESGRFKDAEALTADAGFADPFARAVVQLEHARAVEELGRLDEAQAELTDVAAAATRVQDPRLGAWALAELAFLAGYLRARPADGEAYLKLADAYGAAAHDAALDERLAATAGNLDARRGELARAEAHHRRVEQLVRARLGEAHPARARALSNLAQTLFRAHKLEQALPMLAESHRLLAQAVGADHPDSFQALNALGAGLGTAGRLDEAAEVFKRVLDGYRATLGANHPRIGTAARNLGEAYARGGKHREAVPVFEESVQVYRAALGPDTPEVSGPLAGLVDSRLALGDPAAAVSAGRDGVRACDGAPCEPDDEAALRLAYAKALLATKAPRGEVRAQATRAAELFGKLGPQGEEQRREAEALVAAK